MIGCSFSFQILFQKLCSLCLPEDLSVGSYRPFAATFWCSTRSPADSRAGGVLCVAFLPVLHRKIGAIRLTCLRRTCQSDWLPGMLQIFSQCAFNMIFGLAHNGSFKCFLQIMKLRLPPSGRAIAIWFTAKYIL